MSLLDRLHPDPTIPTTPKGHPTSTSRTAPDTPVRPVASRAAARAAEATGVVMGALTGVWTAALSWLCLTLPVLLVWAASAQTTAPWDQAVRVATDGWLLVHRIGIDVPGGRVGLLPLALAALPLALSWAAGRRIGGGLAAAPGWPLGIGPAGASPAGSAGESAARQRARRLLRALAPSLGGFALGYAVVAWAAAVLARGDGVAPVLWQALVLGPLVPLLGAVPAALHAVGAPVTRTVADLARLPARVRRTARAAGAAVAALLGAGALLVLAALAVHHDRVAALHTALAPGVVGGAVLTLAQAALLPNLAVWGVSFLAGPGFLVGAGALVTPAASRLTRLPLVPVLGAVPPPGPMPGVLGVVLLLPVLVGAGLGWTVARRRKDAGVVDVVCDALAAAALSAAALTVLVAVSGGPAGPGALASVGASPWRAGLALIGELGAGAAAAAWITHRRAAA